MRRILLLLMLSIGLLNVSAQNENLSNGLYFDGEPFLAIDPHHPDHIIVAWMGFTVGSPLGIKVKVSQDGGNSWSASTFLPHMSPSFHSADPSIAFDTSGHAYACYIDYHQSPDSGGIFISRSPDGGLTWGTPLKVMDAYDDGAKRPIDRPWFCINPVTNHFYVTSKPAPWIPSPNRPYFRTSADAGVTWAPWRYIDTTDFLVGNLITAPMAAPAAGNDGVFHCIYPSYLSTQNVLPGFIHVSSVNDGAAFVYRGKYLNTGGNTDTLPKMGYHLAIDPSDPQKMVFNFTAKLTNGDLDIYIIRSTDGGSNWSNPIRVNDDAVNNGKMQDLTWCSYDVNGDLIVGWRDRRDAAGTGYSVPSEIWGAVMRRDSAGFSPNFKISDTLAPFIATYLDANGNDFMNIAMQNDTMYAVWGDVRSGVLNVWFDRRRIQSGAPSTGILLTDGSIPGVSLYPNPTDAMLYLSGETVTEFSISNMTGQIISHQKLSEQKINVSAFARGIYIIQLITAHGTSVQRFVKD